MQVTRISFLYTAVESETALAQPLLQECNSAGLGFVVDI